MGPPYTTIGQLDRCYSELIHDDQMLAFVRDAIQQCGLDPDAESTINMFRLALGIGVFWGQNGKHLPAHNAERN